jgi:starch-binding outer membrane protein, SusD/RagB family
MKHIKAFTKFALATVLLVVSTSACTDLKEEVYGEITPDEAAIITSKLSAAEINTAVRSAYDNMAGGAFGGHNSVWSIQEVSSDEAIIPQRGGDWYDGGQWLRMHRHEYTKGEDAFKNAWNAIYKGIAICNRLIVQVPLAQPAIAPTLVAELRVLRAYYYWQLCDLFGTGPIMTKYPGDISEATAKTRAELYTFIETEVIAGKASLSKNVNADTYGRLNYWGAQALLVRLYMNAGVYKGAAEWDKAIAAADEIIAGGKYSLEANYFKNFYDDNNLSKENIFVIPFDEVSLKGNQFGQMSGHYETQKTFNLQAQPWNGYCTLAAFYDSYEATDARRNSFLAGPQFAADGTTRLQDDGADDPDGKPLTFTKDLNEHFPKCFRQAGCRFAKYKPRLGAPQDLGNDVVLFRYADVLLSKAEAKFRKSAGDADALAIVNSIRTRAGVAAFASLDEAKLLAERGREMVAEATRRQDLIRFGKYGAATTYHPADTKPCLTVFPVPQTQIDANKNLTQNECYK